MTPVVLLTDGYIANGSEPWLIPDCSKMSKIEITHPQPKKSSNGDGHPSHDTGLAATEFRPYQRNADLARPWAVPGTPGFEHRIGGLEKQDITGNVSYDPANHQHMVSLRAAKVAGIKPAGPAYFWTGAENGEVLLLGWGGTYGAIKAATLELLKQGVAASSCQLRYINPLPEDLGEILKRFKHVIVPELNLGQLRLLVRSKYAMDIKGLNKVQGQPFTIGDIVSAVKLLLKGQITGESYVVPTAGSTDKPLPSGG
jgi:2-oxoglutarate ferredoxin oxidoreductase subunit alpha